VKSRVWQRAWSSSRLLYLGFFVGIISAQLPSLPARWLALQDHLFIYGNLLSAD